MKPTWFAFSPARMIRSSFPTPKTPSMKLPGALLQLLRRTTTSAISTGNGSPGARNRAYRHHATRLPHFSASSRPLLFGASMRLKPAILRHARIVRASIPRRSPGGLPFLPAFATPWNNATEPTAFRKRTSSAATFPSLNTPIASPVRGESDCFTTERSRESRTRSSRFHVNLLTQYPDTSLRNSAG